MDEHNATPAVAADPEPMRGPNDDTFYVKVGSIAWDDPPVARERDRRKQRVQRLLDAAREVIAAGGSVKIEVVEVGAHVRIEFDKDGGALLGGSGAADAVADKAANDQE